AAEKNREYRRRDGRDREPRAPLWGHARDDVHGPGREHDERDERRGEDEQTAHHHLNEGPGAHQSVTTGSRHGRPSEGDRRRWRGETRGVRGRRSRSSRRRGTRPGLPWETFSLESGRPCTSHVAPL